MAKIQCKMCGGLNDLPDGVTSGVCQYCGSLTTFPKIADEQTEHLYSRAESFRQRNDFDKAVAAFESILDVNSEDPEAYWGLVLSRYGIEYVEDPATHERIPTCHRVQYESILADPDYQNALKYASPAERDIYEKEAQRISEIQKDILRISAQEKPYDVFICYKESTDGGTRTKDSTFAQEVYYQLANQGLKVFFSRITLEDKLGQQYEPYIFAALNSAKVMLVIGSKKEYFEAVWVKNEWSRFLALKKKDRSRLIIPCYKDMDPYDIPEELSIFQCQDMGKIGFIQDLIRGIMKVVNTDKNNAKNAASSSSGSGTESDRLVRRIHILMEQGDWDEAKEYCRRLLESDPENPELYLLLCLIQRHIPDEAAIRHCYQNLSVDKNFRMAIHFATPERKKQLQTLQQEATASFYLRKCVEEKKLTDVSMLCNFNKPLNEDENFCMALKSAPPEFREEILKIKYTQAEHFLNLLRGRLGVSSLEQSSVPLASEELFQTAMSLASETRRKELAGLQKAQSDCFLRKCMAARHVSGEDALAQCDDPLAEDENFKTAFTCAPPERKKELVALQQKQVESFVQKCVAQNQVSSEMELSRCPASLAENVFFRRAVKYATSERKAQLTRIQYDQSDEFLRKCMEAHSVSDPSELANVRKPLGGDPLFLSAQYNASDIQRKNLDGIAAKQENLIAARKAWRNIIITALFILVVVLACLIYFSRYQIAATFGGAEAKYRLAQRYEQEQKDMEQAAKWYRKAAERGHAEAQYQLGICFSNSNGVPKDRSEAAEWYRKAAEQGHAEAQYNLARAYKSGDGVKQDLSEAVKWYRKAAEQGHDEAKKRLISAEMMLNAQNGDAAAQYGLGLAYEVGRDGMIQDQNEALKWYRKAAAQGYVDAQFRLGQAYETGYSVMRSISLAMDWYRMAAAQGHADAQFRLGQAYESGLGVTKDLSEAVKWYRKAAEQGHDEAKKRLVPAEMMLNAQNGDAKAQYDLAQAYETGSDGMIQDQNEALKWYRKAAEQGYAEAQYQLGYCFSFGYNGVTKKASEAEKWFRKAADQGHAGAQFSMGLACEKREDLSEALQWYRKAAAQGYSPASRKANELQKAEDARNAEAVRKAEAARRAEEARKAEEARRAEEIKRIWTTGIITLPGNVELKMVKVEHGTFTMGAKDDENDGDETPHRVTLTKDFYIGRTEVTQAQWKAVMGENPSYYKGDDLPVECVSWDDAQEFCRALNKLFEEKLPAGYQFGLPTEAQWEFAAKGGNKSRGYKFSGSDGVVSVAWYDGRSGSHPVGQKTANELGLYDMSGNVGEWCRDSYQRGYAEDPEFLLGNRGSTRVFRGGDWGNRAGLCRVAYRGHDVPGYHHIYLGFRLALVPGLVKLDRSGKQDL